MKTSFDFPFDLIKFMNLESFAKITQCSCMDVVSKL